MVTSSLGDPTRSVGGGRYRLGGLLGTGPSSRVVEADDTRLHRAVAVKVLHSPEPDLGVRVRAAAQAASRLTHPHLVAVFDWGEEGGGPTWIVSELLGGGSLRGLLDRGHRLTPSQALVVGLQAARALGHAHDLGLVHGVVSPANVLFDDDGTVRVADLGVARVAAEGVGGAGPDAAPEVVAGLAPTGRSDVHSLARVLVEAVTGSPLPLPPVGAPAPPPSPLVLEDLGPLAGPLGAALAPDPAARPDARALVAALARTAPALPRPRPMPLAGVGHDHPGVGPEGDAGDDRPGPGVDPDPTPAARPPDRPAGAPVDPTRAGRPPDPAGGDPPVDPTRTWRPSGPPDGERPVDPTRAWRPPEPPATADRTVADGGRLDRDVTRVGVPPPAAAADLDDEEDGWDEEDDDGWDDWDPRSPTGRRHPWPGRILLLLAGTVVLVVIALLVIDILRP